MNIIRFTPVERFRRLLKVDRKEISQVYIYAIFNGFVTLSLPLGIQAIVNLIQGGEMTSSWMILVAFVIGGIALSGILQLMQLRIVENIAQKIFSRASFEFAYRIPKISHQALRNYYAPELANRFFDTMTIQKGLPKILIDFSLALFQIVIGLVLLSFYHTFFILFSLILIALVYLILAFTGPKGLKTSLEESKFKYKIAFWLEEIARTKLSFKLIGSSDMNLTKSNYHLENYLSSRENHFRVIISQSVYLIGFKVLIAAGLLITGSILVFNQEMNIGQFVAAEIIIILIIASVEKLIKSLEAIYDVLTGLEKIGYVFDMPLDQDEGLEIDCHNGDFSIAVDNVSFQYEDGIKPTLSNIQFEIPGNKSVYLTGHSNSGKSTLLQIISGIIKPNQGIVRIKGLPIGSLNLDQMRKCIGYALSNNDIFQGTILENITMERPEATVERVSRALEICGLNKFISSVPMGLKTIIDPEGRKVPRNIQNRIILARAIATDPKWLVLEDPLDHVKTDEKRIIIERLTAASTPWNIIVASVDEVWSEYISEKIVLDEGMILENSLNQKNI